MNITNKDYFTFNVHNSALVVGQTGTGKTELVRSYMRRIEQAFTPEEMKYVIFDLKQVEFDTEFDGGAKEEYLYTDIRFGTPEDMEYLEELATLAKDRAETEVTIPFLFIYIEECDLAVQYSERFEDAVFTINRYAQKANMKLIFSTSRVSKDIVTEELRDSFDVILAGTLASDTDAEHLGVAFGTETKMHEFVVVENARNNECEDF